MVLYPHGPEELDGTFPAAQTEESEAGDPGLTSPTPLLTPTSALCRMLANQLRQALHQVNQPA